MFVRSIWLIISVSSSIALLRFCLDDLSMGESCGGEGIDASHYQCVRDNIQLKL